MIIQRVAIRLMKVGVGEIKGRCSCRSAIIPLFTSCNISSQVCYNAVLADDLVRGCDLVLAPYHYFQVLLNGFSCIDPIGRDEAQEIQKIKIINRLFRANIFHAIEGYRKRG